MNDPGASTPPVAVEPEYIEPEPLPPGLDDHSLRRRVVQIAGVLLGWVNPRNGRRWAHVVSLMTAGVLALVSYMRFQWVFGALFFGMFAVTNYQILQALHAQARYGSFEGDEDWWKR